MNRGRPGPVQGQMALPIATGSISTVKRTSSPSLRVVTTEGLPDGLGERVAQSWKWEAQVLEVVREAPPLLPYVGGGTAPALVRASADADLNHATDYTATYTLPEVRLALRVRSFQHLRRFGHELVLRASVDGGRTSEATKILGDAQSAQYYVYAFADPTGTRFMQWVLVDLQVVRQVWADPARRGLLGAKPLRFSEREQGLALEVSGLKAVGAVVCALLVTPSYYSLAAVRAQLADNPVYAALNPHDQRELARLFLRGCYQSSLYVGPRSTL